VKGEEIIITNLQSITLRCFLIAMHLEILTEKQKELLSYLARFKRNFYLVGGRATALQIGHCRSIDFDLFLLSVLKNTCHICGLSTKYFHYTGKFKSKISIILENLIFLRH
jgi:hypothetical protein